MDAELSIPGWVEAGTIWAGPLALVLAAAWLLWRARVSIGLSVHGDLDASGSVRAWVKLGLLRFELRRDPGGALRRSLFVFGLRVQDRSARAPRKERKSEPSLPAGAPAGSTWNTFRFIIKHWDPRDLGRLLWKSRRNLHFRRLSGEAWFGFTYPERTGEVYGALCVLTSVVPGVKARVDGAIEASSLAIFPDWSVRDRIGGEFEAGLDIRFVRLAVASAFFLLAHWHRARPVLFSHA